MRFLLGWLLLSVTILQAQTEKEVASTLELATVYKQGVQLVRTAKTSIPAGTSTIRFTNLSAQANSESVAVSAIGNFTILSVEYRINYLNVRPKSQEIEKLEKDMKLIDERYVEEDLKLRTWKDEEGLILSNKEVGGANSGLNPASVEAMANLWRTRLPEVRAQILTLTRSLAKMAEDKQKLNNQLNELNAKSQQPNQGEVVVTVDANNATDGEFTFSYYVQQAYWSVRYDLRVTDLNSPIDLDYKAVITQNTGEKWDNIKITLSNGNPMLNQQRPIMYPWFLQMVREQIAQYDEQAQRQNSYRPAPSKPQTSSLKPEKYGADDGPAYIPTAVVSEAGANIEFEISERYTVESGNKPKTVSINRHKLKADYVYACAPKLDPAAYLLANVTQWGDLFLMPGPANIYLEGAYTGKTMLNPAVTNDTMEISLGRDNGVKVKRVRQALKDKDQFLGGKRVVRRGWDIEVRNNKRSEIKMILRDQVPMTQREDTEVTLDSDGGARHETTTGFLTWELTLKPGQTEKKNFKYTVKYPKEYNYLME